MKEIQKKSWAKFENEYISLIFRLKVEHGRFLFLPGYIKA